MDETFITEQAFNFDHAQHKKGTNRYVFDYPEHWKSNQNKCDLSVGIRNIILIPSHTPLDFNNWFIIDKDYDPKKDNTKEYVHEKDRGNWDSIPENKRLIRPTVGGHRRIYNYRLSLPFRIYCDNQSMTEICASINEEYKKLVEEHKKEVLFHEDGYDKNDLKMDYLGMEARFSQDGTFTLNTFSGYFFGIYPEDIKDRAVFTAEFLTFFGIDPKEEDNFNDAFEKLCQLLDVEEDEDAEYKQERERRIEMHKEAEAYFARFGVYFQDVGQVYVFDEDESGKRINLKENTLMYRFRTMSVVNMFSRKNLLLASSIAEDDRYNYLGLSNPTDYINYAEPKSYHITAAHDKFWVDLYDSINMKEIELPIGAKLIMECCFKQKPRQVLSRVNEYI